MNAKNPERANAGLVLPLDEPPWIDGVPVQLEVVGDRPPHA